MSNRTFWRKRLRMVTAVASLRAAAAGVHLERAGVGGDGDVHAAVLHVQHAVRTGDLGADG